MSSPSPSRTKQAGRWLVIAACLGLLLMVLFQWRTVSELRRENLLLRAQSEAAPLQAPSQTTPSAASEAIDTEQVKKERLELLRLRNEVRQLRESGSAPVLESRQVAPQRVAPLASAPGAGESEARTLAAAAARGDSSALDKLAKLAAAARTMGTNEQAAVRSDIQAAFGVLGAAAGKRDAASLQAIWQASRMPELQGFAVQALGQAAGQGNEAALKPLLDPESYLILPSSAVGALKPAADAGNARAIEALAATAGDPNQQALWYLAADGLATAAGTGNATAIDSLATLAAAGNQSVRQAAVFALEAAARQNQPLAQEALRKLGWR